MGFLRTVILLRYVTRLPLGYVIRLTEGLPCELRELYELRELRELNRREPDSPDSRNSRNHDASRESRLRIKANFNVSSNTEPSNALAIQRPKRTLTTLLYSHNSMERNNLCDF